ncbi:hypothetical protein GOP47_0007889 [Adiantum capillus-veneris]|uniref:TF-B3 domain-containing protein n=2 Tax=Adiantum capillus-veneris TaxID=13818 RepID=A0A9D4V254_ADICA|nr:hypothetical protein GOP47_0007889 [Adiantum capillus-veneris]
MDMPVTENIEADTGGFILAQLNQANYLELQSSSNLQEGHLLLNGYFAQEGTLMEAVQVGPSVQTCTPTNGMYAGPGLKDITGSISVSNSACLRVPSELYATEGAVKDLSAFLGSSYSTVFSDSLGSIIHDTRSPEQLTTATWHRQTPGILQNSQGYLGKDLETPKEPLSQGALRVVRPPGEGRGKNHMLPRYWPRMTEKELQLLSTQDSNSKITPLFEKVLSASDAGKVGRLVLPKACAEAYFPPISQPEGVPLIVQDINGKEWVFQFRFWPNNNSRMYVLEGITPCIQSMNLQAGDTVIFSRLDPEGKLVMGCRRAPNISISEENQKPMTAGSTVPICMRLVSTGSTEKVSTIPSLTRLLMQTEESSIKAQGNKKLGQFNVHVADNGYKLYSVEKFGSMSQDESFSDRMVCEKRKAKDVVAKAKRQQVEAEKIEFRKNWEAAQNLLRSPPNVIPSIVTIEGYDFEEYEEPPVFGKDIPFTACSARSLCSEQDAEKERDSTFSQLVKDSAAVKDVKNDTLMDKDDKKDIKQEGISGPIKVSQPYSGLETLASVATTEENTGDSAVTSTAVTTKHPRHRPGCSCIVCIQPPSGQGPKHKPNCDCNVCLTVKRRFQTLMLRRKKLQSERAAENAAQRNNQLLVDSNLADRRALESGCFQVSAWQGCIANSYTNVLSSQSVEGFCSGNRTPSGFSSRRSYPVKCANSDYEQFVSMKGTQFDLNSQPDREEEMNRGGLPASMKRLLQSAGYSLDVYLKEQGLTSLVFHDQALGCLENPIGNATIPKEEECDYSLSEVVFANSDVPKAEPSFDQAG